MADYFSPRSSTPNVYTFDSHTGKLSYAVMQLSPRSSSHSTHPETPVHTHVPLNAEVPMSTLGEGSRTIIEEIPIRGGQTVYFVAKLDPRAPPRPGFVDALDPCIRKAKRQVLEMERLVRKLEAALAEEDESDSDDYEGDVDEYEDEATADSGYESDDGGSLDVSGTTTDYPPAPNADEDSRCASESDAESGGTAASPSLSSDSSSESVTFDPPSSSVSPTEEFAPSTASATQLSAPSQITHPSVSALLLGDHAEAEDASLVAGDASPPSLPYLDSSCGDGFLSLEAPSDRPGFGCPPTEEEPLCTACYGQPIRLVWGDEPSDESLSDLVDEHLGESDFLCDELVAGALVAAQLPAPVEVPLGSPVIATEWSLSRDLEARMVAISGADSSSSMSSLFSERPGAPSWAGTNDESDEEPLAEAVKRRRKARRAGRSNATRRGAAQACGAPEVDESAEIPRSTVRALHVRKGKSRRQPTTGQSARRSTVSSTAVRQEIETPPLRRRKRRRDDEKEEGEISEYESDPESDPDIPLAQVLASRGLPAAKRVRITPAVVEPRRLSRDGGRSRRSWVHRWWEERLTQRHVWAGHEGRRGMRVMSTDGEQLRREVRAN